MLVQQGQGRRGLVDPNEFVGPLEDIFGLLVWRRRLRYRSVEGAVQKPGDRAATRRMTTTKKGGEGCWRSDRSGPGHPRNDGYSP